MNLDKLRILIAEDDVDDAEFICESFSKNIRVEKVEWVKNGKELLDFLNNDYNIKPDVILTDINMPMLNGIEALEEISVDKTLSLIPVFVYSSSVNPAYEKRCRELGAFGYLIKPLDLQKFSEIPNQLIDILISKTKE